MRNYLRMREAAVILACCASGAATAAEVKSIQNAVAGDWPSYHRTYDAHRYSPLDQINKGNVHRLNVAWTHQAGEITQGLQSTPIVIDGIIYYSSNFNRVFALDGRTGEQLWHFYPKLKDGAEMLPTAPTSRGVTVANGLVYLGTMDGRAIALDQKSGKQVWETELVDTLKCGCMFTSPPLAVKDKLIYGSTQGGIPARGGGIFGVDQKTGKKLWYFDPVKEGEEHWGMNDFGEPSSKYAGVGAWHVGSYDAELDLVYYGTSNPTPWFDWAPHTEGPDGHFRKSGVGSRPGDNLYSSSVLALRPDTGELVWHFQENPHDDWDFDAALGEFVFIDKDDRKLMLHMGKNGFVYLYDRTNGKIENVWTINKHVTFVKTIDPKTGELIGRNPPVMDKDNTFCPSMLGGRSWNAGSYNPETGVWFNSRQEMCEVAKTRQERPSLDPLPGWYAGADLKWIHPPGDQAHGALDAWDPLTGKKKWSVIDKYPRISTVLSTKGNVVFSGDMRGYIYAYSADTGKELWKFNMGSASRGGIVTYTAGGEQYILVPSGIGSAAQAVISDIYPEVAEFPSGATLFAFKLSR
ncbi:MAG: PQQ-binding-like beta-propeller repeat protein [Burkholderiales bacterium]|nr:PQQ-binding-like beta-propeller repeat protein [Burkholderiales bacterium]